MPPAIRCLAGPLTLLLLAVGAPGEEEPDPRPHVRLTRDLSAFPAGAYEVTEAYSLARERTLEKMGEPDRKKTFRQEQELHFGVSVQPPAAAGGAGGELACSLRRLSIQLVTESPRTGAVRWRSSSSTSSAGPRLRRSLR